MKSNQCGDSFATTRRCSPRPERSAPAPSEGRGDWYTGGDPRQWWGSSEGAGKNGNWKTHTGGGGLRQVRAQSKTPREEGRNERSWAKDIKRRGRKPPPMSPKRAQDRETHPHLPGRHGEEAVCGVDISRVLAGIGRYFLHIHKEATCSSTFYG